jgi:hypothetical protein
LRRDTELTFGHFDSPSAESLASFATGWRSGIRQRPKFPIALHRYRSPPAQDTRERESVFRLDGIPRRSISKTFP